MRSPPRMYKQVARHEDDPGIAALEDEGRGGEVIVTACRFGTAGEPDKRRPDGRRDDGPGHAGAPR